MVPIRQTNFSSGELSPPLWGRTDLPQYGTGLKRLRDFFVTKGGAAMSRPGTRYTVALRAGGDDEYVRLIPFVYSDTVSYVLQVGYGYIRFISYGAVVESSPGVAYEVSSPYSPNDLRGLKFAQVGDVLTITSDAHAPYELKRFAHTTWTMTAVVFKPIDPYFIDTVAPYTDTYEPRIVTGTAAGVSTYPALPYAPDNSHPAREWEWMVTVLAQDNNGNRFESIPVKVLLMFDGVDPDPPGNTSLPTPSDMIPIYPDMALTFRRIPGSGLLARPAVWNNLRALAFLFYRGSGGLYGYLGQTSGRDFVDVGAEPDYSIQPPMGVNPFQVYNAGHSLVRTEFPLSVAFFQGRRVFAGTAQRPGWFFASATDNYTNFDEHNIPVSGESLKFELAAQTRQTIQSLLSLRRLLIFTDSTVWSVGGTEGNVLDFDSVDAVLEERIGATSLQPLAVDSMALYAREKGVGVRALIQKQKGDGGNYTGVDISVIAQHFFLGVTRPGQPTVATVAAPIELGLPVDPGESHSILSWCYQEDPWGLVWAVREDGVLLSLSFSLDGSTWGWQQHTLNGGKALEICSVPEDTEDVVYVLVERTIGGTKVHYIERFASRVRTGGPYDDICLDSAITYQGFPSALINGLASLEGQQVWAVASGMAPQGPYTVVGGEITLDETPPVLFTQLGEPVVWVHVGILFQPELETLGLAQTQIRVRQKTVTHVGFEVDQTVGISVGQDFDHLKPWKQRTVADNYDALTAATALVKVPVLGKWDDDATACLRQTEPLPVTVLGVTREVETGGT